MFHLLQGSGCQPGVLVPPGVRQIITSLRIRSSKIFNKTTHYWSLGGTQDLFFLLRDTEAEKGWKSLLDSNPNKSHTVNTKTAVLGPN